MAERQFKFSSPGIFLKEIDNSQLPALPAAVGPVVIGRTRKGPGMIPVSVSSFSDFVEIFGEPVPGVGGGDQWRAGNTTGPTYAAYAAQAYLRNNAPVTMIRLLGEEAAEATAGGRAGWQTRDSSGDANGLDTSGGGAYGLFLVDSGSLGTHLIGNDSAPAGTMESGGQITMPDFSGADATTADSTTLTVIDYGIHTLTLTFNDFNGNTYSATADGAEADSTAVVIGLSGVNTNAKAALAIYNSIYQAVTYGVTSATKDTADDSALLGITLPAAPDGVSDVTLLVTQATIRGTQQDLTGTLAAIFYAGEGSIALSGTRIDGTPNVAEAASFIKNVTGKQNTFILQVSSSAAGTEGVEFNFDLNDKKFIRKAFNTNPTLTNHEVVTDKKYYWLGESFENDVKTRCTTTEQLGIVLGMKASGSTSEQAVHTYARHDARTPWVVGQHRGTAADFSSTFENVEKLFRLVSRNGGSWASQNLKVSIQDIRASRSAFDPYGTFSVLIRKVFDQDSAPEVVERYTSCNLNPESENFISKKIGDQYLTWIESERTHRLIGSYANRSNYVRVDVRANLKDLGADLIPFGFYGPPRFKGFSIVSGSSTPKDFDDTTTAASSPFVVGTGSVPDYKTLVAGDLLNQFAYVNVANTDLTTKFQFPVLPLRLSSKEQGVSVSKPENTYWGITTVLEGTDSRLNESYGDMMRPAPYGISGDFKSEADGTTREYAFYFTLDNLSASSDNNSLGVSHAVYQVGSRKAGNSFSALGGVTGTLDKGFDRFTMPMIGGSDGLNILQPSPFGNHILVSNAAEKTNYAYYTAKRAIDMTEDPEDIEMNILTAPGIRNEKLTKRMIDICELRTDTLAIIDLPGGYTPATESDSTEPNRLGSVTDVITSLEARAINSSYACAYYPWIQIRDFLSGNNLWVPPSVVALGVLGSSETRSELWFAPAGFTRGGLSLGAAGLPVVGVRQRLTSKERDKLYENNVNPIASFPAEGIVVFGQKTLQVTPSALDRINVRRLMIFVKREVSRMAKGILFGQNTNETWSKFLGMVNPFLTDVKIRFGLTDYLVILDESTTTPDLIDRNILYAKVFLKPARSIEFIALDFVITNTGADFL